MSKQTSLLIQREMIRARDNECASESNPWSHTHRTLPSDMPTKKAWPSRLYHQVESLLALPKHVMSVLDLRQMCRCCRHLFKHVLVGRANCTCGNVCFLIPLTYYWKEWQLHIRPLYASIVRIPQAPLLSKTQTKHSQQPPEGN